MRSARPLLTLCGLMALSIIRGQDDPRFKEAHLLDSLGRHERALDLLRGLTADTALRADALAWMAQCEFDHLHKADQAFTHLQQAIAADPRNARYYFQRGTMYQEVLMLDRSLDDLLIARSLADTLPLKKSVEMNIGATYLRMRRFADALDRFDALLALDSTDVGALLNKANALDELGRKEEALGILEKLTRLEPTNTAYMNNIGFVLSNLERYAEAIPWYDKSLALDKDDGYALNNRGYAKLKSGDLTGALKDVERSIKVMPGNPYAYRNLGLVRQAMGQADKACEAFEEALRRNYTKLFGTEVKEIHDAYCH